MFATSELICDTSVVVKWFYDRNEEHAAEARAILRAHVEGQLRIQVLDLVHYELGNVFLTSLRASAKETNDVLANLAVVLGEPLRLEAGVRTRATELASAHGLSFYDASHLAAARSLDIPLLTADRALVAAGGISPTKFCEQTGLGAD